MANIGKGVGKTLNAIGKLGDFLWNNPISKAIKFGASLALGPSLFVVGGALSLVGRAALEVGQVAHTKLIRTFDNSTVKKVQAGWEERLKSYKSFVTSSLESSMFAWYDTADFVRGSWAARQDEAGYGNTTDGDFEDPTNVESYATVGGEKKFKELEVIRVANRDNPVLGKETPSVTMSPINESTTLASPQQGRGRGSSGSLSYNRKD